MYKQTGVPLEGNQQTYFMIKAPGRTPDGVKYSSRFLAEGALRKMSSEAQSVAEIVAVDAEGRQLLFENV